MPKLVLNIAQQPANAIAVRRGGTENPSAIHTDGGAE